ncbi:MAG: adenosylmethionine--8-amino-7-oxononanoate transaminase [Candidatus Muproteobacteria bacterium RBG_16_62_13]|uniref:Adenosylmethionine-8-amino-7-oxononanoate aminotransferase n=1 Tax=Candidatus Muproteobacteria bacterium RBG_16_62_13 TaxID=1817756 RepID=A0A1F6T8T7_9PROT|nr:MAG: adenosylmethionine--8-amino-7-oxononanoate transaminase [Candidatus Muproteobacteria bacterium RBG_16_62_13]
MSNPSLADRDRRFVWHPCTPTRDLDNLPPIPIRSARGAWLEDFDGKRYLDAISSWWVNLFGHSHPAINAAIRDQLEHAEHVMLAGFTHEPVIRLSERLAALTGLGHCYYASDGSAAVEIALKMSFHYWRNRGEPRRTRYVCLANSYHGETLGTLSVSDVGLYRQVYAPLLLQPLVAPSPDAYARERDETSADVARRQMTAMERLLDQHRGEICAVIVEPLVQCAGGMRMHDPLYLKLLRAACDRHRVHLIADEIAVGFGRTGTMFAGEQAGVTPDFLLLGKGLTGGYLPLSVCLTTDDIYRAFDAEHGSPAAFLHSHSYTGNALACAAANATLDLFESGEVLARNRELAAHMARATAPLAGHPQVADIRQTGMILAIELCRHKETRAPYPAAERRGRRVYRYALEQGALLRPLGDVIYFMPPYVITPEEIDRLARIAADGIARATTD